MSEGNWLRRFTVVCVLALGVGAFGQEGVVEVVSAESQAGVTEAGEMRAYYEEISGTDVRVLMMPIPGGVVRMGSDEDEVGRLDDVGEGPVVEVRIEPFWMGAYEVTWGEYGAFSSEYKESIARNDSSWGSLSEGERVDAVSIPTPHHADCAQELIRLGQDSEYPASVMTQFAARQYTKWLSKKSGRFYRLPTEAEWEHAAGAGRDSAYFFGDEAGDDGEVLNRYAWFGDNSGTERNPDGQYHRVGQKEPNAWGLYDIYGNVAEYVMDQAREGHREALVQRGDVIGWDDALAWPSEDEQFLRVVKGGGWLDFQEDCRSAARRWSLDDWRERDPQFPKSVWNHTESFDVGFRVIRPLGEVDDADKLRYWEPESTRVKAIMFDSGRATIQRGKLIVR